MIRKATTLLMLLIGLLNVLHVSANESVSVCASSDEVVTVSTDFATPVDSQSASLGVHHSNSDPCGDCQHQGTTNHQCHLGHCQYIVASVSTWLPPIHGLLRREFSYFSWPSTALPSPDRPPQA